MKNSFTLAAIMVIVTFSFWSSGVAQTKIVYLNSDELIRSMPETDSVNKILSDLSDEYQRMGEDLQVKYNQSLEAYKSQAETLKPLEKKLKESELIDMGKRIQSFTAESQADYQKRHQELYQPITLKAQNAIKEVGKENNILYILDSAQGVILYQPDDESFNILPLVQKKLGIKQK